MVFKDVKKIYLIAGESSGDALGASLIKSLKEKKSDVIFLGIGGPLMEDEGLISLFPMKELAMMGIFEILPHIFKLLKRIKETVSHIVAEQPDVIITIDSPSFCKRVIAQVRKRLKQSSVFIKKPYFFHYVAPSVWAWRPGRAKKIAKLADHLFCLLPFEPSYFKPHGLDATFVGHQLTSDFEYNKEKRNDCVNILILPGSRKGEIEKLLPIFLAVMKRIQKNNLFNKSVHFILPTLPHVRELVSSILAQHCMLKDVQLVESFSLKKNAFEQSHFAMAASGTVSLELSKYAIPHIIAYKINSITAFLLRFLLKTPYVALPNILSQNEIVPECLQKNCHEDYIYDRFKDLVEKENIPQLLQDIFLKLKAPGGQSASDICADIIYKKIQG